MKKIYQHHWQSGRSSSKRRRSTKWVRANQGSRSCRHAFTLIEVLIVIMIIAILASASLIATGGSGALSLEATARIVAADLRLARNHAIKFNTQYTINFDFNTQSYEILHTGTGSLPVPQNQLAGSGVDSDKYIRTLQKQSMNLPEQVFLRQVKLNTSKTNVSDLAFGPMGGTGPSRNEDTVLILSTARNGTTFYIPITVSWITGQAWVDDIQTLTN
ncbi:Tfp pilus assembly protein FimT/FimU [uncultured Gimesia sp.]|uniref:pilus assembly FimT family protein n=1 Tax=uncultured Gimesia sp. TaxID=1678688 RepID=UPI00262619BB|nr:GspH/FimT family pseudopilin [uncultured Gimesia sp.]